MSIQQALIGIGARRARGRMGRVLPWIGVAFALVSIGAAIRRKGFVRGSVDSALNAMPVVGSLKAAAEMVRGRDFIAPKQRPAQGSI
jgi:hypothetical protein